VRRRRAAAERPSVRVQDNHRGWRSSVRGGCSGGVGGVGIGGGFSGSGSGSDGDGSRRGGHLRGRSVGGGGSSGGSRSSLRRLRALLWPPLWRLKGVDLAHERGLGAVCGDDFHPLLQLCSQARGDSLSHAKISGKERSTVASPP